MSTDAGSKAFASSVAKDESACQKALAIECNGGGDPDADYPTCVSKTEAAKCVDVTVQGDTYTGVEPIFECTFN